MHDQLAAIDTQADQKALGARRNQRPHGQKDLLVEPGTQQPNPPLAPEHDLLPNLATSSRFAEALRP